MTVAKNMLYEALITGAVTRPYFSVVYHLPGVGSYSATDVCMNDRGLREQRLVAVLDFVGTLQESEARQMVQVAYHNPSAIHALADEMHYEELLCIAVLYVFHGIADLADYAMICEQGPDVDEGDAP